jgi:hypothetical protein
MGGMIKAARDWARNLAINQGYESPNVDAQYGCVCYRDPIDSSGDIHEVHPLSRDIGALVNFLSHISAIGGGDGPEDWVGAYTLALNKMAWRQDAKAIVHIADAPAHGARYCGYVNHEQESPKLGPLIAKVAKQGIRFFGFDIGGGATRSFAECRKVYKAAGGWDFTVEAFVPEPPFEETEGILYSAAPSRSAPPSRSLSSSKACAGAELRDEAADMFGSFSERVCADALAMEYV